MSSNATNNFYLKKNRLQQLKGFVYTAKYGGATKAAEQLGLSMTTVFIQVQSLEKDIGIKLVNRNKKKFSLTDDGKEFLERAEPLLEKFETLDKRFYTSTQQRTHNSLSIAGNHYLINTIIANNLALFATKHQDCKLNISCTNQETGLEMLENNEIDFLIYPLNNIPKQFAHHQICFYEPVLIYSKQYNFKLDINEKIFTSPDFLSLNQANLTLPNLHNKKIKNSRKNISFGNCNFFILRQFIKAGLGFSILPSIVAKKFLDTDFIKIPLKKFNLLEDVAINLIYNESSISQKENNYDFLEIIKNYQPVK